MTKWSRCVASCAWIAVVLVVIIVAAIATVPLGASPGPAGAQSVDAFDPARVVEIVEEGERDLGGFRQSYQVVRVQITGGPDRGQETEAEFGEAFNVPQAQRLREGERVVLVRTAPAGEAFVVDRYRLPWMGVVLALFFGLALAFARWRGMTALLGLSLSLLVLVQFVVPQIMAGANPLVVTMLAALVIAVVSIYLAHGFYLRTTVAIVSTVLTLAVAAGLAMGFVSLAKLFGAGKEEAFYLQLGLLQTVNLRGLLLGGIILGALGVLDDITTAQAAVVAELKHANPTLSFRELYRRGLAVGQEHITALVNTLVLAYAGASLPLFILFTVDRGQPLWVTLNSEYIGEEVVRAAVGSIALILAVPITTALAAWTLKGEHVGGHAH
ncbi:MAG: YibE/F family protein [Armatimonadota bacterium]|nr:YibE/F family protein [Armatimonadota bacterium]MDR5698162.1 YibE/F family protein [Armatimonadota bacterium]